MSVEEARSEAASNEDLEDEEQYETITISEAPLDEERYDRDIDMFEEKRAIENFKGIANLYIYIYFFFHVYPSLCACVRACMHD